MSFIRIRGARTHTLKNISLDLPRDQLIVLTGLSGSGKSSLAFDTIYAEGQRRYVESLSAYARQFLSMMDKPDVDLIEGLSPAISIEQKTTSHNPRSTVGTITEIYDYLRVLFARVGTPHCPKHQQPLKAQNLQQMLEGILKLPEDAKIMLLAPMVNQRKGEYLKLLERWQQQGFSRVRIDGEIHLLDQAPTLNPKVAHSIDIVIDRLKVNPKNRLRILESLETAIRLSGGLVFVSMIEAPYEELTFSSKHACPACGFSIPELSPRSFSFNNPQGACEACDGLGAKPFFDVDKIILDEELSLSGGAIRGWDRRNYYYHRLLQALAEHYQFDIHAPFNQLPKKIREVVLYGSGREKITFIFGETSRQEIKKMPFEGVLPNMERRYRDTESDAVREELSQYLTHDHCQTCGGSRLGVIPRNVFVSGRNLAEITQEPIKFLLPFFKNLQLSPQEMEIAKSLQNEIASRLAFLINVGLDYLSLHRSADTLSGGETQRIRLASQIGSGLVGVLYVLDEPSIGLHQRDNNRLLQTLAHLRDLGNTVLVVEHDEDAILAADHVVDMGPGAGRHGGNIVAQGTPQEIIKHPTSLTGQYLRRERVIENPGARKAPNPEQLIEIVGASGNNLKKLDVDIPVGLLTCVTGVSGSGKSTLINDTLYPVAATTLNRAQTQKPLPHHSISGLHHFDKVVNIDQAPIGRTPRSNPATYTGLFTGIRELFSSTQESRSRGYSPGRFSFNVQGGRCEACQGDGVLKVEMHFLADVYVKCEICQGTRYQSQTLDITYKGKNISDILNFTVEEAVEFFAPIPPLARRLETLMAVGLSYIQLGQSATTLSGGEAQRIKLAKELSRRDTGRTLYILDEPTTGLHFYDIDLLLKVLFELRDRGNTIVIIEHQLDVIECADWIIDLGPEGGSGGGELLIAGNVDTVAKCKKSFTGQFLKSRQKNSEKA